MNLVNISGPAHIDDNFWSCKPNISHFFRNVLPYSQTLLLNVLGAGRNISRVLHLGAVIPGVWGFTHGRSQNFGSVGSVRLITREIRAAQGKPHALSSLDRH